MDRVVVKIGGSIITDPTADTAAADVPAMRRTAQELAAFDGDMVLVHGAGSYGHPYVERSALDSGIVTGRDRMDLARLQRLQNQLNERYTTILQEHEVPAIPLQPSSHLTTAAGTIREDGFPAVERLLADGLVPTLYGTPAVDVDDAAAILSGDRIAPFIADLVDADLVLHATDVDGVYTRHPDHPDAERLETVTELPEQVDDRSQERANVTGGIHTKLAHLFDYGQRGRIIDGTMPDRIADALHGAAVGTVVAPEQD